MSPESNWASPTVYTPERIRSAARDHHAYQWSYVYHWNADGTPWTEEQRQIYNAERVRLQSKPTK